MRSTIKRTKISNLQWLHTKLYERKREVQFWNPSLHNIFWWQCDFSEDVYLGKWTKEKFPASFTHANRNGKGNQLLVLIDHPAHPGPLLSSEESTTDVPRQTLHERRSWYETPHTKEVGLACLLLGSPSTSVQIDNRQHSDNACETISHISEWHFFVSNTFHNISKKQSNL